MKWWPIDIYFAINSYKTQKQKKNKKNCINLIILTITKGKRLLEGIGHAFFFQKIKCMHTVNLVFLRKKNKKLNACLIVKKNT